MKFYTRESFSEIVVDALTSASCKAIPLHLSITKVKAAITISGIKVNSS